MPKKKEKPPAKSQEEITREFFERERDAYEKRTGETVIYPDTIDYPDNPKKDEPAAKSDPATDQTEPAAEAETDEAV